MGYFGGLGLEIETYDGLFDVGLPDGVGGIVVVNEILPLVAGVAGSTVKGRSIDVGRLNGAVADSSGEVHGCEVSGQSRLVGDRPSTGRVRGRQHAGKRGLQLGLRVGGAERHEGDEKRQELRGCGRGREGRGR